MKYRVLVIFGIVSNLYSMVNQSLPAYDRQKAASNMAIHYKNAGQLIPDSLLSDMHPNVRGFWQQYNQQLIAAAQQAQQKK